MFETVGELSESLSSLNLPNVRNVWLCSGASREVSKAAARQVLEDDEAAEKLETPPGVA